MSGGARITLWGGTGSRSLAASQPDDRARLIREIQREIDARMSGRARRSGAPCRTPLVWEHGWFDAELAVREQPGTLVVTHQFRLSAAIRWAAAGLVVTPLVMFALYTHGGCAEHPAAVLLWAGTSIVLVGTARLVARVRLARLIRRAVARAQPGPASSPSRGLPSATVVRRRGRRGP